MKRYVSIFLILIIVGLPCCFLVAADTIEEPGTYVYQYHTSDAYYAGWQNQSPVYYGNINSSNATYPFSLAVPQVNLSSLRSHSTTVSPESVVIFVSSPLIRQKDTIVYIGVWNGYTQFYGNNDFVTYFEWVPSTPGYRLKVEPGSSLGYASPNDISVNAPSNFSPSVSRQAAGATGGASSVTVSTLATRTPNNFGTSYVTGSVLVQPSWAVASNSFNIIKTVITSDSEERNQIKITLDSNDLSTCTIASSAPSTEYLHSGVFVPIVLVVNANDYTSQMLADLDSIVSSLADISGALDINLSDIVTAINTGNASVLSALSAITTHLSNISNEIALIYQRLEHYDPNNPYQQFPNGAIGYIEWYVSQILSNTDDMVAYLDNILDTLTNIQSTLEGATDQAESITDDLDTAHDQEQAIFDQASIAIGNLAIQDFRFGTNNVSGINAVGSDFTSLWNSLGAWTIVYTFSMLLGVALIAIRHSPHRSQGKLGEKVVGWVK